MSIMLAAAVAMATCEFKQGEGVDANVRAAREFVQHFNEGRFEQAGSLVRNGSVVHSVREKEQTTIQDVLQKAEQAPAAERAHFRIRNAVDDGSNTVVLELVDDDSNDGVGDVWVFDVGSGCILNIWTF